MWPLLQRILCQPPAFRPGLPPPPRLVFSEGCISALRDCIAPEIAKRHEGIAYLLGKSDGNITLVSAAVRPVATTTPGSFSVSSAAMAKLVRIANDLGVQVVGQLHTHPGDDHAHHSDGDVEGARVAYTGYISIVLPDYGRRLPSFDGAAAYMFKAQEGFVTLAPSQISVLPARLP